MTGDTQAKHKMTANCVYTSDVTATSHAAGDPCGVRDRDPPRQARAGVMPDRAMARGRLYSLP